MPAIAVLIKIKDKKWQNRSTSQITRAAPARKTSFCSLSTLGRYPFSRQLSFLIFPIMQQNKYYSYVAPQGKKHWRKSSSHWTCLPNQRARHLNKISRTSLNKLRRNSKNISTRASRLWTPHEDSSVTDQETRTPASFADSVTANRCNQAISKIGTFTTTDSSRDSTCSPFGHRISHVFITHSPTITTTPIPWWLKILSTKITSHLRGLKGNHTIADIQGGPPRFYQELCCIHLHLIVWRLSKGQRLSLIS